jgi:hypothetical protein
MDFHLGVSVSKKQVMLLRKVGDKEYLFKVYQAKDIRLPAGTAFARRDGDRRQKLHLQWQVRDLD